MNNHTVTLTEQQLNNLRVFLQRVPMEGKEVPAFVEIMQVLIPIKDFVSDDEDKA